MTQTIEAIYTDGVLKPIAELPLRDKQRVRLTVETIDEPFVDREGAVARLTPLKREDIFDVSHRGVRPLSPRPRGGNALDRWRDSGTAPARSSRKR